jgi:alkanesulfonate monooxygenase SsuD/methylene tetrahydromethanopterin reductase-like flavin-dependent oxidoreductase (luciferase family)
MKFYAFHYMPWPELVDGYREKYGSAWVTYPNENFDPERGHELYERYIGELVLAAESGFDGICVNEHHQTSYGLMPSPNLIAGMLIQRTRETAPDTKIAILGNATPLKPNPLHLAEELAMLDVISGGRIISGFVRGIGAEYHSSSLPASESHSRFFEAHDLIVKSWTQPGPFRWDGQHYNYRYVNSWPRPIQQPHPPIWIPSTGSSETIEWAAERGYTYLQIAAPIGTIGRFFDQYRDASERYGIQGDPGDRLGWSVPIYVAETDAQAEEEGWPGIDFYMNELLPNPPHKLFPPNYLSEESMEKVTKARSVVMSSRKTFKDVTENRLAIVGSPETVIGQLEEAHQQLGFRHLITNIHLGTTDHEKTAKNIRMLAERVLPKLRPLGEP